MSLRAALLLALILVPASSAEAYETILHAPLHEPRSSVSVGDVQGAIPTTIRFRDATHAAVTFRSSAFEIRGEVDLAEGEAHITSTQHLVLSGSPFRIEVAPGTALYLVDGLRGEVRLDNDLPLEGLTLAETRLRVASEETLAVRPAELLEACRTVHLWAEPRVHGPVLRTRAFGPYLSAPVESAPGWSEVWVMEGGVWLRGYTWEAARCGPGFGRISGVGYAVQQGHRVTRVPLAAEARIGSREGAPWTVHVREAMEVEVVESAGGRFYRFPFAEGVVQVAGVVLP